MTARNLFFDDLMVPMVINAYQPTPRVGGQRCSEAAADAVRAASTMNFDMPELYGAAEQWLAARLRVGAVAVTAGVRAALEAACVVAAAGGSGSVGHVLTAAFGRTKYMEALTIGGIKTVHWDLRRSDRPPEPSDSSPCVAIVLTLMTSLNELAAVARCFDRARFLNVPVLVNAAAIASLDRVEELTTRGAAAVAVSGSKRLGAPTGSGLLAGQSHFVRLVQEYLGTTASPYWLRPTKEAVAGLVAAVRDHYSGAHPDRPQWLHKLLALPGAHTELFGDAPFWATTPVSNADGGPLMKISVAGFDDPRSVEELASRLWSARPRMLVGIEGGCIVADSRLLSDLEGEYFVGLLKSAVASRSGAKR